MFIYKSNNLISVSIYWTEILFGSFGFALINI